MQAMAPQVAAPVAVVEVPVEETKYDIKFQSLELL
jgi:hypothetical protein